MVERDVDYDYRGSFHHAFGDIYPLPVKIFKDGLSFLFVDPFSFGEH